jgi:hypothetical protein
MTENNQYSYAIGNQKDILTDVEYVKNQLAYLEGYQVQILTKSNYLNSFSSKWNGLKEDEVIYKEIDRWLKCYNQLSTHLKVKVIPDEEVKVSQSVLEPFVFYKPVSSAQDNLKGFSKFGYSALPFYRIAFNKRNIKVIKNQILNFKQATTLLKSLAFKVEAFYMDGV